MAADVHRDVPAPYSELEKAARKAAEARAKEFARLKKQAPVQANPSKGGPGSPAAPGSAPSTPAPATPAPVKKSFFHIWPN